MKKPRHPDFAGKFVLFTVVGSDHTLGLDNPRIERQCDRWVVAGIVPRGYVSGNWCAGAALAMAWDRIIYYLVFDSVDDYQNRIKASRAELKKSKRKA